MKQNGLSFRKSGKVKIKGFMVQEWLLRRGWLRYIYICTVSTERVKQLNPKLDTRFVLRLYDSCVICAKFNRAISFWYHIAKIRSGSKKIQDCWSHLNASQAARNSFAGRMFVTSALDHNCVAEVPQWILCKRMYLIKQMYLCIFCPLYHLFHLILQHKNFCLWTNTSSYSNIRSCYQRITVCCENQPWHPSVNTSVRTLATD